MDRRHRELAGDVARSFHEASTDVMRAAALLDVLWPAGGDAPILRSIDLLEAVGSSTEDDALVLSDIAAAHLLRAELGSDPRAPLSAMEAAAHALERAPDLAPARFNLALALQWSGLAHGAREAWLAYLRVDSTSGWAREARDRVERIAAILSTPPSTRDGDLGRLAREDPQLSRETVWDSLLGSWGEAVMRADTFGAERALRQVHGHAAALAAAWNDESLIRVHRALSAMPLTDAHARACASLLARHAAARRLYLQGKYDSAGALWDELQSARCPLPAPGAWVASFRAATLTYRGRAEEAERLVMRVLAAADERDDPALVGRGRWILGTTLLRSGRTTEALTAYESAEAAFDSAGEHLSAAATQALQAETRFLLGDETGALRAAHSALGTFVPSRPTVWHHNVLFVTSQAIARRGLVRAARAIASEDVLVAASLPVGIYETEARIARAALARLSGDTAAARHDIVAARRRLDDMPDDGAAKWLGANLRVAEAGLNVRRHPTAALAGIDSAVRRMPARDAYRRLPALALRAQALLELDSVGAAARVHRQVLEGLEGVSAGVHESTQRLILLGDLRGVTETLAGRLLDDGDTIGALDVLERERSRLGSRRGAIPTSFASSPVRAGGTTLAFSIVQDTVVAWCLSESTVVASRVPGNASAVVGAIDEVNRRLALSALGARTDSILELLYDLLVRSALPSLSGVAQIVIVADGEISNAPFAAFRDRRTGRYLIQDVELSFAPSIRTSKPTRGGSAARGLVTAIGVSTLDRTEFPTLTPLRHAEGESRTIASLYQEGRVIAGPAARPDSVIAALQTSRVVHVAAHAVLDPGEPLESYIILDGGLGSSRLRARDIALLSLDRLELVVLAACETQRGSEGRAGGLAGLTWSFLSAGAGGVVGSTWRVDDEATTILMTGMHERYADGEPAASALRAAQLAMLESTEPRWRSPTHWAAFRYATATVH